tara:strand:- start:4717 stop:5016 length:300 start_codon:yes stop_codon:yes gene_type:complete
METKQKVKLIDYYGFKEMWGCLEVWKDANTDNIHIMDLDGVMGYDVGMHEIPYDYNYNSILEIALVHFKKIGLEIKSYYWNNKRKRFLLFTNDRIKGDK